MNRQPHLFRVLGHVLGDYPLPAARRKTALPLARAARYVSEFGGARLGCDATDEPAAGVGQVERPGPGPRGRRPAGPSSVPEGVRPVRGRGTADTT